jgi:hypothetical protein
MLALGSDGTVWWLQHSSQGHAGRDPGRFLARSTRKAPGVRQLLDVTEGVNVRFCEVRAYKEVMTREHHRPRHDVSPGLMWLLRPVFRYSVTREAYVLRLVGGDRGPVLQLSRDGVKRSTLSD